MYITSKGDDLMVPEKVKEICPVCNRDNCDKSNFTSANKKEKVEIYGESSYIYEHLYVCDVCSANVWIFEDEIIALEQVKNNRNLYKAIKYRFDELSIQRKTYMSKYENLSNGNGIIINQDEILRVLEILNFINIESAHWINELNYYLFDINYVFNLSDYESHIIAIDEIVVNKNE